MRVLTILGAWCGLAGVALAVGCARVDVRKVPARSDYREWDDGKQAAADSIKGIRYYMPRPYLSTARAMTVGGGDYFISGRVVDGRIVSVAKDSVPSPIRGVFPAASDGSVLIAASAIHVRTGSRTFAPESTGADSEVATTSVPVSPAADVVEPKKAPALKVVFDRATFAPTTQTVLLTVTLAVNAGFAAVDELVPVVVPVESGVAVPAKALAVPATSIVAYVPSKGGDDKGTPGSCTASIRRSDVQSAPYWVAGVRFQGKSSGADGATKSYLYYNPDEWLSVAQATTAKPPSAGKPAPGAESTTEGEGEPAKTTADFSSSGDPQTNPIQKLNDAFEIVYLPDFDQQFAVDVQGGLGQAKSKVGLENGWMLERAETAIDNRELGKFVFKQIEKFTDIAAELARAKLLPTLDTPEGAQTSGLVDASGAFRPEATGSRGATPQVLLRVRYVLEAQPGLYPVLKPGEVEAWKRLHAQSLCDQAATGTCGCGRSCGMPDSHVYLPCPPFTVVAKDVYRRVVVELVGVAGRAPANAGTVRRDPAPTAVSAALREVVDRWLDGAVAAVVGENKTAKAVLGDYDVLQVASTVASGAVALHVRYKGTPNQAELDRLKPMVAQRRGALQKAVEDVEIDVEVVSVSIEHAAGGDR